MKSSIRNVALLLLLASALLLSATSANAVCAFQSIIYGQTVNGSLSTTDCTDDVSGSLYYADYYQFTGTAGEKIYIQQSSTSIDPWLALFFPSGNYTNNDNGGGGTTARIPATSGYYSLLESGTYLLEATSKVSNSTGSYTLTLAKEGSTATLPSAPTNVTATAGNGSATVSFTPGSIGSGTLVIYWAACGVDNTHLVIIKGSSSPITVTGLTNGTVYYCWALTESTVGYSSNWSTVSNPVTPTAATAPVPATGKAIEFCNANINHYFMTASIDEAAFLDSKPSWGWARTGKTFDIWLTQASAPGNASPVCRFYGLFANGTVGSHFYTVDPAECEMVKGRLDWGWGYENNAFYAVKPFGISCQSGTSPVYRAFNNGMGGAPNHRYMTNQTDVDTMVSQGWVSEGVAMCAASGTSSGGATSCGSGGGGGGLPTVELTNLPGATSAVITKQKEATGTVIDDRKVVSGEYLVQINGAATTHGNIRISIPVVEALLPTGWNQASFAPEYFDATTTTWKTTGNFIVYDSATKILSFTVNIVEGDFVSANKLSSSMRHVLAVTDESIFAKNYHVTATGISGQVTVKQLTGSNFVIHYYEAQNLGSGANSATPVNWNGNDVGFEAPSYIRHLDVALNNAFREFAQLVDSKGNLLMPVVSTPQHVYVEYLGGEAGLSPIGGPLKISTKDIAGVEDMNGVAAHELFHVFQGFFLGEVVSHNAPRLLGMQWFLEATANYYAALANNMNDAQKIHLYADKFGTDYLSVPIDTSDDQNHYALAYFFDWLPTSYGNTAMVGDIFRDYNDVTMSPLLSMDRVLKANGEAKGLSGAHDKYMANFMTHPDSFGGFNLDEKAIMQGYTKAQFLSTQGLNAQKTFSSLSRPLFPPLSSTYLSLDLTIPLDALLVIDSSKSDIASNVVKSYAYDFAGSNNAAYQGKTAVDDGLSFPYAAKNPLTIKNFKAMEQLFVNSTALVEQKSYNLNVDYYLLVKPAVKQVQTNAVLWDSSSVGNIPPEYIKGYDVYKDVAGKYTKINSVLKGRIPYVAGSTEIALTCTLQDCNESIKPTDKIVVVIEDKYGNKWPDITVSLPPPTITSLSPTSGTPGATVTITGTGFGAMQGTSKVSFNGTLATIIAWSDKLITAIFPAGATPGPMIVMANGVQSNEVIFTVSGDCINDSHTGLCWDTAESSLVNWADAGTYCSGKGTRLPTIAELISFATSGEIRQDPGKEGVYLYGSLRNLIPPLVARGYIFNVVGSWSSTTTVDLANYARFVVFSLGTVGSYNKGQLNYARCVR